MVAMKASAGSRVLMLLENNPFPQDGRVRREARTLVQAGYQVSVISPARRGQPWREIVDQVRVYRYPAPPDGDGFWGFALEYGYSMMAALVLSWVVFFREGFDIVHAHNPPDTFVLVAAGYKLLGKRFIFDHHDLSPEMYYARFGGNGNRLVHRALVFFEKLSCRLADHTIATNDSYKRIQMERGGVPEERVTVVRNGPDLDRLRLVEPDPELRRRGRIIIGYVGVIGYQDGLDYLLRALRHLISDLGRDDFFCVIIGQGDAWRSMKELAKQLGLDEHVCFTGRVSDADLLRNLSSADLCVDPDPSNPFNDRCTMIKITEYMALAKPVVAFDLPEHRVTAQDAALYAEPNNELNFAEHIMRLMDDPELREKMGRIGRQRIQAKLAWNHQETELLKAYQSLQRDRGDSVPVSVQS